MALSCALLVGCSEFTNNPARTVELNTNNPARTVELKAFEMDVTEVTVDAYRACVTAGACTKPDTGGSCNWDVADRGNHPINCVDWTQATTYCGWVGKRLPTEEEWEAAARGAEGRDYPWGNEAPGGQLCWSPTSGGHTCAVGSFPAGDTPEGLKDMAGNVWEWTSSTYEGTAARVIRGGSWIHDDPSNVRAANRYRDAPSNRLYHLGFRCARAGSP